jgi:hypothetical protein
VEITQYSLTSLTPKCRRCHFVAYEEEKRNAGPRASMNEESVGNSAARWATRTQVVRAMWLMNDNGRFWATKG